MLTCNFVLTVAEREKEKGCFTSSQSALLYNYALWLESKCLLIRFCGYSDLFGVQQDGKGKSPKAYCDISASIYMHWTHDSWEE